MKPFILFSSFCLLIIIGCKKNKENRPECKITKISEPSSDPEIFSYDAEGRLQSITSGNSVTNFTYSGDSIIKQGVWKSVFALNHNGLLAFERREYNSTGTKWATREYEYDGTQLKKMTSNSYSGSFIRTYTWSNGNLQLEHTQGSTYTQDISYEYYTDKPYRIGDLLSWDFFENGVESIRNKNLVKKYSSIYTVNNPSDPNNNGSATEVYNYTYTFDNDGKIISMSISDENNSNPFIYSYEYQCN